MATSAPTVSSSISNGSAPGTNVVATPTRQPSTTGIANGRRISGNASHRARYITSPTRSGTVSNVKITG